MDQPFLTRKIDGMKIPDGIDCKRVWTAESKAMSEENQMRCCCNSLRETQT